MDNIHILIKAIEDAERQQGKEYDAETEDGAEEYSGTIQEQGDCSFLDGMRYALKVIQTGKE